ncbi:hypothetical protein PV327_010644 [Microctonus hyperodae]|uniref:Tektin n=1 Tax=Microctonus hyperodae TaxID=165561 RepID=A0AA39KVB5_MICHY|nr:hypothetical protein PV327_010644 [Microctonus hyperodae]
MAIRRQIKNFDDIIAIVPPSSQKFMINDWHLNNQARFRNYKTHCQLVESVIAESERICDLALESTKINKFTTDRELKTKVTDVKFMKDELLRHRQNVILEINAMTTYKSRLIDAITSLQRNAAEICQKCLIAREHRLGIDLTVDDVEKDLRKEYEIINRSDSVFTRTLEHTNEQIRILKSLIYQIDSDLDSKDQSIELDEQNLKLKETGLNLSIYHGRAPLDASCITLQEWGLHNDEIVMTTMKELNSTKVLRYYIDDIMKEIVGDLNEQKKKTDESFNKRINEIKEIKSALEMQHCEVIKRVNAINETITKIDKNIREKEGFLALAHTRLGNRCQRPNMELTSDQVERQLTLEVSNIRVIIGKLQQTLCEAHATLRYLLKIQIQLEEDINIKTNTLKIDEVECMTLRQSLNFHAY